MKNPAKIKLLLAASLLWAQSALAQPSAQVQAMVTGLDTPWAIAPLGNGEVLITEKSGALILAGPNGKTSVKGVPKVRERGQGGLLDITSQSFLK